MFFMMCEFSQISQIFSNVIIKYYFTKKWLTYFEQGGNIFVSALKNGKKEKNCTTYSTEYFENFQFNVFIFYCCCYCSFSYFVYFWCYLGLNSRSLHLSHTNPALSALVIFFRQGLTFFNKMQSEPWSSYLCLPCSWDYRKDPPYWDFVEVESHHTNFLPDWPWIMTFLISDSWVAELQECAIKPGLVLFSEVNHYIAQAYFKLTV
jgi:hypothetical protein